MMTDFTKMMDAAKAENSGGIDMRGGKKYTSVAVRMEVFRRHVGASYGIQTEIVEYGRANGDPVVVRAIIRDEAERIVATGTAEEIRGAGNVNKTSALENAETSAIGRALAMLGLSGGEFASLNEIDGVGRKTEAKAEADTAAREQFEQFVADKLRMIPEFNEVDLLVNFWKHLDKPIRDDARIIAALAKRKAEIIAAIPPATDEQHADFIAQAAE